MSFYYTRIPEKEGKVERCSAKKVNAAELNRILNRVSRPTYNSELRNTDYKQVRNYMLPTDNFDAWKKPITCSRRRSEDVSFSNEVQKDLSEMDLQRIVNRLCKSTISFNAGRQERSIADANVHANNQRRSMASSLREKSSQAYRPTTASRAKTLGECTLCINQNEMTMKNSLVPFVYPHQPNHRTIPIKDLDEVMDRVSAPTFASKVVRCPKTAEPVDEVFLRSKTPLASGLKRSRTIKEIINRLYYAKQKRKHAPLTTTVTIYT